MDARGSQCRLREVRGGRWCAATTIAGAAGRDSGVASTTAPRKPLAGEGGRRYDSTIIAAGVVF